MSAFDPIDTLLDHFEQPRNYGPLADADIVLDGSNPGCEDRLTLYLKVVAGTQQVARLTFEGRGCAVSQAAASLLTTLVPGCTLANVVTLNADVLMAELGRDVVRNRPRCATLALDTLKRAVELYRADHQNGSAESCSE